VADADIPITAGSGTKVDTRTVGAGTDEHRQVIVVGDPATATEVAAVTAANGLDVDVTRLPTQTAATSAVTNVAASAASVTLIAANANRKALYIFNAGTSNLFVRLGAVAATTTTGFTYMVPPNGFWELPDDPIYVGEVRGIWSATGGSGANLTELTA
jgi:hypothetical protein